MNDVPIKTVIEVDNCLKKVGVKALTITMLCKQVMAQESLKERDKTLIMTPLIPIQSLRAAELRYVLIRGG